jgi:hypothetical protein
MELLYANRTVRQIWSESLVRHVKCKWRACDAIGRGLILAVSVVNFDYFLFADVGL